MSIEAMYPSRRQARSQNPLFARELQRKRMALMAILTVIGLGLLLLQLLPSMAHADAPTPEMKPVTTAVMMQPVQGDAPKEAAKGKAVRQIPLYQIPVR